MEGLKIRVQIEDGRRKKKPEQEHSQDRPKAYKIEKEEKAMAGLRITEPVR